MIGVDKFEKNQIPCGFSDLWVDLVSPGGPLGRLGQRLTAPTVGRTRIRHVVQLNNLSVCYRMVMEFFYETHHVQILRCSENVAGWPPTSPI